MTVGVIVLSAILVWLAVYLVSRGAAPVALRASFGPEFGHWAPVSLLAVPGLLLIFHGKSIMRDAPVSFLETVEVLGLLAMVVVVFFLAME